MASTVVRAFAIVWPRLGDVVQKKLSAAAPAEVAEAWAELLGLAARCAMLAMQASAADFLPVLAALATTAATAFAQPGGEQFHLALSAALLVYCNCTDGQTVLHLISSALDSIAQLPALAALAAPGAGEYSPDLALVGPPLMLLLWARASAHAALNLSCGFCVSLITLKSVITRKTELQRLTGCVDDVQAVLSLTSSAARSYAGSLTVASPFLYRGLACAIANISCNNKDVFSAALNATDSIAGEYSCRSRLLQ